MTDSDDNSLVQKTLQGDSDAFRLIVDRYKKPLLNLVFRLTGNRKDIEDIVQESFIRAYKDMDKFEQKRSFFHGYIQFVQN